MWDIPSLAEDTGHAETDGEYGLSRYQETVGRTGEANKRMRPLDPKKTLYPWKELIIRDRRSNFRYAVINNVSILAYFGLIILFIALNGYFVLKGTKGAITIMVLLVFVFFLPVFIEWGLDIYLTYQNADKIVIHLTLRLPDLDKTFEIHDVVEDWGLIDSNTVRMSFKHTWRVGRPEDPYQFHSIKITGSSPFIHSIGNFANRYKINTDVFGIATMQKHVYVCSLKASVFDWRGNELTATSWATMETEGITQNS